MYGKRERERQTDSLGNTGEEQSNPIVEYKLNLGCVANNEMIPIKSGGKVRNNKSIS